LHETLATPAAASERGSLTEAEAAQQVAMLQEARAAYEAGLPVDSPQAGELASRFVASIAAFSGDQGTAEVRRQIVEASPRASDHVARYAELLGRYHSLVATINGEPQAEEDRRKAVTAPASTWLYAAVEALGS
jgi:DNA-binding GntR family transcriptional regulator